MKKELNELTSNLRDRYLSPSGQYSEYTTHAVKIAEVALCTFSGKLLEKALAISRAIVDFEDELNPSGKHATTD